MAKVNATRITNGYRCGVHNCNSLLLTGTLVKGHIEPKCSRCGTVNVIIGEAQKGPVGEIIRKPLEIRTVR